MKTLALALGFTLSASAVLAQPAKPMRLGEFKDWELFSVPGSKGKMCFVGAKPKDTEPKSAKRDSVYFFITSRPGERVKNELSVRSGYAHKEGSTVTVEVGKDSFTLFTNGDGAWIKEAADETRLINAMRKGASAVVKGTSKRGTSTTDTYSLAGFDQAMDRMAKAPQCR